MKLSNRWPMRRALYVLAFAVSVAGVTAQTQIDGNVSALSTYEDAIDMRFSTGTLLGVTVTWAADGPCAGAADLDLVRCPNCADAAFLHNGRLSAQGTIDGGGRYVLSGEFGADGAAGTLKLTAVTGCPADHTLTWTVGTPPSAGSSSESTAITSMNWAALKVGVTAR